MHAFIYVTGPHFSGILVATNKISPISLAETILYVLHDKTKVLSVLILFLLLSRNALTKSYIGEKGVNFILQFLTVADHHCEEVKAGLQES